MDSGPCDDRRRNNDHNQCMRNASTVSFVYPPLKLCEKMCLIYNICSFKHYQTNIHRQEYLQLYRQNFSLKTHHFKMLSNKSVGSINKLPSRDCCRGCAGRIMYRSMSREGTFPPCTPWT